MTVPLIYRCHFSRIDGIRWYSLCRARRTHTALSVRGASCIFQRRQAQQKLDNCIIIRWGGKRESERDTQKGEWKSAVTDTRFGDPQKIRKRVLADVSMLSAPRLVTFHRASLNATAEDLRSTLRWSWIRSCARRGEIRKYVDSNDEISIRIRAMVLASFGGPVSRARHAKSTWRIRDATISHTSRWLSSRAHSIRRAYENEIVFSYEIYVNGNIRPNCMCSSNLNIWNTLELIYCRYRSWVE